MELWRQRVDHVPHQRLGLKKSGVKSEHVSRLFPKAIPR